MWANVGVSSDTPRNFAVALMLDSGAFTIRSFPLRSDRDVIFYVSGTGVSTYDGAPMLSSAFATCPRCGSTHDRSSSVRNLASGCNAALEGSLAALLLGGVERGGERSLASLRARARRVGFDEDLPPVAFGICGAFSGGAPSSERGW